MPSIFLGSPYAELQLKSLEWRIESARPSVERFCNFTWERCMLTGGWEGQGMYRQAERP
jgi:hypothetical protein